MISDPLETMNTRFPILRTVLREEMVHFSDDQLVEAAYQMLPGTDLDDLEINFRSLGSSLGPTLSKVGQVAGQAAPGAISGAMQGATMGAALGPYGMLAGAALGAVGGGITSYSQAQQQPQPQQRPTGARQPVATQPPQQVPQQVPQQPMPPMASPQSIRPQPVPQQPAGLAMSQGTQQVLMLLSRPEVLQALMAVAAGAMGRQTTQVGGQQLPTQSVVDAIGYAVRADAEMRAFEGYGLHSGAAEAHHALMASQSAYPPTGDPYMAAPDQWIDDAYADFSPHY